jgi:hypothetical protein
MKTLHTDPTRLTVDYHDGRSDQAQAVSIWVSQGMLELAGHGILRQVPIHHVQWPDHTEEPGVCITQLPGGGTLRAADRLAWDAWQAQQNLAPATAFIQNRQGWRWSLVATLMLLAICAASYVFALPTNSG